MRATSEISKLRHVVGTPPRLARERCLWKITLTRLRPLFTPRWRGDVVAPGMSSRAASTASASTSGIPTEEHVELRGHEGPVLAVRFNRDGRYLLTCGKDRTFRLWNPYKATLIKTYGGHAHEVLRSPLRTTAGASPNPARCPRRETNRAASRTESRKFSRAPQTRT